MQVSLQNINQSYGGQRLFNDLNLEIPSGKFFSLLGPSGCGKTTILRMLAGFIRPDSGKVLFGTRDMTHVPVHKRNIGIVFQDYALFPDRSVLDNVCYGLLARGVSKSEARKNSLAMLEQVGLGEFAFRMPSQLSGGQKQRVAMARALVIGPELLLLDEPLSALDVKLRLELRLLIRRLQIKSGITTLFVTHDQSEALAMSDGIAVLERGRVLQLGSPKEIYEKPSCLFVSEFFGCNRFDIVEDCGACDNQRRLKLRGGSVLTDDSKEFAPGMKLSVRPTDIDVQARQSGANNRIPGVVNQVEYRGATVEYIIETEEGKFHAEVPSDRPIFILGDSVDMVLPANGRLVGVEP
ncbi:MAG: ABC transporter ATP-binding protein [Burkholderiaceae bacterium]|nr:ABC transporter ATP-binding protein [Burkholderiaceae bacterium]